MDLDFEIAMNSIDVLSFKDHESRCSVDSRAEVEPGGQAHDDGLKPKRTRRLLSSSGSIDSGIFVSPSLDDVICDPEMELSKEVVIEDCPWSTGEADLILDVEGSLFPVKRMTLWENSGFFKDVLANTILIDDDTFKILTVKGVNSHDMEDILRYFHDQHLEVPDIEVLDVLRLAHKLDCPKIVARCEVVLSNAADVHPIDLLKIAEKYSLENLKMAAICQAAAIPKITRYTDFDSLQKETKVAILVRMLEKTPEHLLEHLSILEAVSATDVNPISQSRSPSPRSTRTCPF